jgi:transposase
MRSIGEMAVEGPDSTLHVICNEHGSPGVRLLTEGQVSDHQGAVTMLPVMPPVLIANRGCDADWFRQALRPRDTRPCISSRANRLAPIRHGEQLDRCHDKIKIMLGRLKDWRRVATRYDRCAHTFMSAALTATVRFWLPPCKS